MPPPRHPAAHAAPPAPGHRGADIPLRRDGMGRFLPWLVALMVFLATLAAATAQFLGSWGGRWDSGFAGSVTVQISPLPIPDPAVPGGNVASASDQDGDGGLSVPHQDQSQDQPLDQSPEGSRNRDQAQDRLLERRVQAALHVLADFPGVDNARPLPMADAQRLVEPWLGDGALIRDLPLPALIDVSVTPGIDVATLRQRLSASVPGVTVEEPGSWLKDLQRLALLAEGVAIAVVVLIGGAAVVVVSFAARAGLAMHQEEVELLHLMGATDLYIARQFTGHVTRLAALGGVPASLTAILTLGGFSLLSRNLEGSMLPIFTLPVAAWLWMTAVPLAAIALTSGVARWTVLRALGRLA